MESGSIETKGGRQAVEGGAIELKKKMWRKVVERHRVVCVLVVLLSHFVLVILWQIHTVCEDFHTSFGMMKKGLCSRLEVTSKALSQWLWMVCRQVS